ncbi:MAG: hypothetical protein KAJ42_11125 [Gemmatimonadetes bacterium]|nr:hypothetical protein [Gemmatimonadota bacterium]
MPLVNLGRNREWGRRRGGAPEDQTGGVVVAVVMFFGGIAPLSGGMGVELFVGMKLYQPHVEGNI